MDHRYLLPRWPAVGRSLHAGSDRRALQIDEQAGRPLRHHPPDGVLHLQPEGPRGAGALPRSRPALPGDHHLDTRHQGGLPPRARSGHPRNGHPRQLQRLPHLQKDEAHPRAGDEEVSGNGGGGLRGRRHAALPSGGHHPRRLLRLRRPLRQRTDEDVARCRHPRAHPRLRHHGLRRAVQRGRPAAQCAGHRLRTAALFGRFQRHARMARPQRFLQGRQQRRHRLALRRLRRQLFAAWHRRAHRQHPA